MIKQLWLKFRITQLCEFRGILSDAVQNSTHLATRGYIHLSSSCWNEIMAKDWSRYLSQDDIQMAISTRKDDRHHQTLGQCYRNHRRRRWHPTPVLLPGKPHGRRSWWAAVCGVTEGQTRLSDFTFTFHFPALEKEMATHSSDLA